MPIKHKPVVRVCCFLLNLPELELVDMKLPILSHKNAAILLLSLFLALESCHSGTDYNQKKVELPGVAEVSRV